MRPIKDGSWHALRPEGRDDGVVDMRLVGYESDPPGEAFGAKLFWGMRSRTPTQEEVSAANGGILVPRSLSAFKTTLS